jgi:hypothetical protein
MKMSKFGYFSEFLLFPPLVLIATLLAFRSLIPPQPMICAIVYSGGLVGWTLIEYARGPKLFEAGGYTTLDPRHALGTRSAGAPETIRTPELCRRSFHA